MRMQSILVRPYVLDCLSRYENEARKDQPESKNPKSGYFNQKEKEALEKKQ